MDHHPIDPELSFRFVGLNVQDANTKLKADVDKVSHYLTINEVRANNGMEPLEKGGDIVLNQTYITAVMGRDGAEGEVNLHDVSEIADDEGDGFVPTEEQEDEGDGFEDTFKARRVRVSVEL